MDNTFFVGINSSVSGIVGMALLSVLVICALVVGATVGYRVYRSFLLGGSEDLGGGGMMGIAPDGKRFNDPESKYYHPDNR